MEQEPGIAGVVGPKEVSALGALLESGAAGLEATGTAHELPEDPAGEVMTIFVTRDGTAARMLVIPSIASRSAPRRSTRLSDWTNDCLLSCRRSVSLGRAVRSPATRRSPATPSIRRCVTSGASASSLWSSCCCC